MGQVVLVQKGYLHFLKKTPFIPNPTLNAAAQRTRMQKGLKMNQAGLIKSPNQKIKDLAKLQQPKLEEYQPIQSKQSKKDRSRQIDKLRKKALTELANYAPA